MEWADGTKVDNPRPSWFPTMNANNQQLWMRYKAENDALTDLTSTMKMPFVCQLL